MNQLGIILEIIMNSEGTSKALLMELLWSGKKLGQVWHEAGMYKTIKPMRRFKHFKSLNWKQTEYIVMVTLFTI